MLESAAVIRSARAIAESAAFQDAILFLIIFNGVCLGAEAIPALADQYGEPLFWIFAISQAIFVTEIAIRVLAHWPRVSEFFRDRWNTFDFVIVAVSLVPMVGSLSLAGRVLRPLRLLRVVSSVARKRNRRP
jgi:voltage-gated sodium channel